MVALSSTSYKREISICSRSCNCCGVAYMRSEKGRGADYPPLALPLSLLRGKLFRLAFVPHQLERALGFLVGLREFFLHFCLSFFHLWCEAYIAVVLHAGAGRNQPSHDDVLLQTAQVIDSAIDRGLGEHARSLLERRRRNER